MQPEVSSSKFQLGNIFALFPEINLDLPLVVIGCHVKFVYYVLALLH